MRSGVTGRSRTDTSWITTHGSAIELRPRLSARHKIGLGGPDRTDGLVFPKHARCLLRHTELCCWWSSRVVTIHRPPPCQDGALPRSYARLPWLPDTVSLCAASPRRTSLATSRRPRAQPEQPRTFLVTAGRLYLLSYRGMDSEAGFEPARACANRFAICRLRPLGYSEMGWSGRRESNAQHPASKAEAPPLSYARIWWVWMDSNHRANRGPGLQPGAFNRSATHP
jgi:hypothetical protein